MKLSELRAAQLPPGIGDKLIVYLQLIRFEKPIGFYLLLWPTMWALAIAAEGSPDGWILFVFIAGVFLMRSAGCAINDYADRDIDMHVARTRERPLTSGQITARESLLIFAGLSLTAFFLVLSLNRTTMTWILSAFRHPAGGERVVKRTGAGAPLPL